MVLLIDAGTSMLRQNAKNTVREAEGPVTSATPVRMHPFEALNGPFRCHANV